jgi:aspartate aminotransferase
MDISQEQVIVAPGSKPLLFALFDILEGDVFLPRPSWVSYEPQVKHARKRLFWIETDEHDRHTVSRALSHLALCLSNSSNAAQETRWKMLTVLQP